MIPIRITIVTFAWPPRNSIGAHRPLSWAKYWSEAGANVRVLTAKKYSYDEPLDLETPSLPGVEVIEIDYAKGLSSLATRLLRGRFLRLARKLYRALSKSEKSGVRNPREMWLDAVLPQAESLAYEADIVVSTYDPRAVHQIADAMKVANPRLIWVADYRDLWSLNHVSAWSADQHAKEQLIERRTVGAHADMVCSVSDELSQRQGEFINKPWLCVTNGFDIDLEAIRSAVASKDFACKKPLDIVYTGKLYPGLRDPLPLLKVIADMEESGEIAKGDIGVSIYGGQVEGLVDAIDTSRYEHLVTLHGHVSRDAAVLAQREADLLLLLESPLPEARGVLTGKIFEYMASGVPILSLGSRWDSAIGNVLRATATGSCTEDDPERIRSALRALLEGKAPIWFSPNLDEIGTYSRKAQAMKLLKALEGQYKSNIQPRY